MNYFHVSSNINFIEEIGNILVLGETYQNASFEALHGQCYNMVQHEQSEMLYNQIKDTLKNYLNETMRPNVVNTNVENFLFSLSNVIWPHYQNAVLRICDINMYLERSYIRPQHHPTLREIAFNFFGTYIIEDPGVQNILRSATYKLIEVARQNEPVEWSDLKSTCEMLLFLGSGSREFYQEHFENWLVQNFAEHYRMTCQTIMAEKNTGKLLRMMTDFITREKECIISGHFDSVTETMIIDSLNREIISGINIQNIVGREDSGLLYMLKNHCIEDLKSFHKFFGHTSEYVSSMVDPFFEYICETSPTIHQFYSANSSNNYLDIIKNVLILQTETAKVVCSFFEEGHCELKDRIQARIANLITPKCLSLCIDFLLKKRWNSLNKNDFGANTLDKALEIFKFISDKNAFETCYQQHLCKRLLAAQSNSFDGEKFMLERLKIECGSAFTRRMEEMVRDIETSINLMNLYKINASVEKIEFSAQILTSNFWPISGIPPCILPAPAEAAFNQFQQFYVEKYSKRTLTINTGLGSADLEATFYKKQIDGSFQKESKTLVVSTFQMCVLLKFNEADILTYKQLLAETNIRDQDLKQALAPMVLGKESQMILNRIGKNETTIEENDIFSVNDEFTSKLNRIRIQASKMRQSKSILVKSDENRKYEIESAIIRVMKSRRSLLHDELIANVTKELKFRFSPDQTIIKKIIEALIDREFLKRDESNLNLYHYVC